MSAIRAIQSSRIVLRAPTVSVRFHLGFGQNGDPRRAILEADAIDMVIRGEKLERIGMSVCRDQMLSPSHPLRQSVQLTNAVADCSEPSILARLALRGCHRFFQRLQPTRTGRGGIVHQAKGDGEIEGDSAEAQGSSGSSCKC